MTPALSLTQRLSSVSSPLSILPCMRFIPLTSLVKSAQANPHDRAKMGVMFGTTVAVLGFAMAFFTKLFLLGTAFGVLGAIDVGIYLYLRRFSKGGEGDKLLIAQKKLERSIEGHKSTNSILCGANSQLTHTNQQLQKDKDALAAQVAAHTKTINDNKAATSKLLADLSKSQQKQVKAKQEITNLRAEKVLLTDRLTKLATPTGKSVTDEQALKARLETLEALILAKQGDLDTRSHDLDQVEGDLARTKSELQPLVLQVQTLQAESGHLSKKIDADSKKLLQIQEDVRTRLEKLKQDVKEQTRDGGDSLSTDWIDAALEELGRMK